MFVGIPKRSDLPNVIELQIGDSPFPSTKSALQAGIDAINAQQTHYCASLGLPTFRAAVAANYRHEYGIEITDAVEPLRQLQPGVCVVRRPATPHAQLTQHENGVLLL